MPLSVKQAQNTWQEHRESLTRIRSQLSDYKGSPVRSPARSPAGHRARGGHSPYGRYRQSTPPYLPRLETPPEQRNKRYLRGDRYEVVPPVKETRNQKSRNTDYDSWGEESDDDDEEDEGQYMPQPYPYQAHPYPQVVFGAPFPVYYPPPPPPARNKRRNRQNENDRSKSRRKPEPGQSRAPLTERYEDVNMMEGQPRNSKKKQNKVSFNYPVPTNGFYGFPNYPYYPGPAPVEEPRRKKKDSKYKYIEPRDTPYSPAGRHGSNVQSRFREDPDRLMSYYMKDHPLFAENLIDWLVNQYLDEFIPDLLIDALNDVGKMPYSDDSPVAMARDDIMGEVLPKLMQDVVRSTLTELVDEHMLYTDEAKDPLESFLTRLLSDAVREETTEIVRETVKGMAHQYVADKQHEVVLDDLLEDYIEDLLPELLEESKIDVVGEEFIRDEVIEGELAEEIPVIAKEVLSHYDTKVMRRELKEVSSLAGDKLMESLVLDYLFTLLARQGKVWTESDYQNKAMDDMISSLLLQQLFDATVQRRKTIVSKPLQKLHEKTVTDVALDVLLQELTASLDEDLFDIDEYEQGITDPYGSHHNHNTPINMIGSGLK